MKKNNILTYSAMKSFVCILSRYDDKTKMSQKRMFKYIATFFVFTVLLSVFLQIVCMSIYDLAGLNPTQMTTFGGSYENFNGVSTSSKILLLISAPLIEELIFRLFLSFKKEAVALWLGILPSLIILYFFRKQTEALVLLIPGAITYLILLKYSSQNFWDKFKTKYIKSTICFSAIAFGLVHLTAFSHLTLELIPYAICICFSPFMGGCIFSYLRVNMGFNYGLAAHYIFNIPAIISSLFI